jgi:hypothetical protein
VADRAGGVSSERGEGLAGAHPEFVAYVDALIAS